MKQQSGLIEGIATSIIAYTMTFLVLTVTAVMKKIVWPLICFIAKMAWKGIRRMVSRQKVAKPLKRAASKLPTPEIFKDAPNLARAKSVRF